MPLIQWVNLNLNSVYNLVGQADITFTADAIATFNPFGTQKIKVFVPSGNNLLATLQASEAHLAYLNSITISPTPTGNVSQVTTITPSELTSLLQNSETSLAILNQITIVPNEPSQKVVKVAQAGSDIYDNALNTLEALEN